MHTLFACMPGSRFDATLTTFDIDEAGHPRACTSDLKSGVGALFACIDHCANDEPIACSIVEDIHREFRLLRRPILVSHRTTAWTWNATSLCIRRRPSLKAVGSKASFARGVRPAA